MSAKLPFGTGGDADFDDVPLGPLSINVDDNLETTYGIIFMVDKGIHEFIRVGGMLGVYSWNTDDAQDNDYDRSAYLDIAMVGKALYPVSSKAEIYLGIPLGLTVNTFSQDWPLEYLDVDDDEGVYSGTGLTYSILFGGQLVLSDKLSFLAEVGPTRHSFNHEGKTGNATPDFEVSLSQVFLNVGVALEL